MTGEKLMKLEIIRNNINKIDRQIITLLVKRFIYVQKIGVLKKNRKLSIVDKKRESEILKNINNEAKKNRLNRNFVNKVFDLIIKQSKKVQKKYTKNFD